MALIAPSILAANFVNLERDVRAMEEAGAQILHVDVMDGHFAPNLTIGLPVIKGLKGCTSLLLDVHLMISNPEQTAEAYIDAGADYLSVHYETVNHLDRLVERIREQGAQPGVVLNPHTPVLVLEEILAKCHHVLVMSVNPGFGGQKFIVTSFQKVRKLKSLIDSQDLNVKIEIDGGIDLHNTEEAVRSGVDIVVAGSAIFHAERPKEVLLQMQRIADEAAILKKDDAISL
ncbi:ribulose-phosphate 3-epimerase [Acidobacteria bacterium AH-259-G07]|nr:ribulose-phosphate 3-epimerase [Acidobacteria bacterium AH-259-G07]